MQTRLPIAQVLLEFLNLYKTYREPDRSSTMGKAKWLGEKTLSLATGEEPVVEKIDRIIKSVESEISTAKNFTDWFNLIFMLREQAKLAKSLKYNKNNESLLHETLHAMAGYIICDFNSNEGSKKLFDEQKAQLAAEYNKCREAIKHCLTERKGKGVEKQNQNLKDIVYKFAMLGDDSNMLNEAMLLNLIDDLKIPDPTEIQEYLPRDSSVETNDVNLGAPLCLQPRFCEWMYLRWYNKTISHVAFHDFSKNAIEKPEKEKQKKEAEEKSRLEKLRRDTERANAAGTNPPPPAASAGSDKRLFGKPAAASSGPAPAAVIPLAKPADDLVKEPEGEDGKAKVSPSAAGLYGRRSVRRVENKPAAQASPNASTAALPTEEAPAAKQNP